MTTFFSKVACDTNVRHAITEYVGGDHSPIVIRKSDAAALNYAPIFFDFDADAEDVGPVISEGTI